MSEVVGDGDGGQVIEPVTKPRGGSRQAREAAREAYLQEIVDRFPKKITPGAAERLARIIDTGS